MKILKLKLFQESVCYKKPFAFKVAETYPLPPYSTVIGMFHKILNAKSGEYFPMNISIQGNFESIFSNYQTLRMYKGKDKVTTMPRNVHMLLNVNLILHVEAEDEVIDKIYENVVSGNQTFTLGRNEDLVRIDGIKLISDLETVREKFLENNAYVPCKEEYEDIQGINYRLNTKYVIGKDALRNWEKVDVKYVDSTGNWLICEGVQDEDGDFVFFYN